MDKKILKIFNKFLILGLLLLMGLVLAGCGDKGNFDQLSNQVGASWKLLGKVEAIDSPHWTISQRKILVNNLTQVDKNPAPVVGSQVEVEGRTLEGGTLNAQTIKVMVNLGNSTQGPSGTLIATLIPIPTVTPSGSLNTFASPPAPLPPTQMPPKPGGTVVEATGVIEKITPQGENQLIQVNGISYLLEPYLVRALGQRLVQGATIKLVGKYNSDGAIIVTTVVNIFPPARTGPQVTPEKNKKDDNDKKDD